MESMTSFLENPILLGILTCIITWSAQRLSRVLGKMSIVWITAAVALVLALANELWAMRTTYYEIQIMLVKFTEFTSTIWPVSRILVSKAVPIFVSTQVIYYSLQSKLAGRAIQGTVKVLRRSVDRYEYLAEIVTGGNHGDKTAGT